MNIKRIDVGQGMARVVIHNGVAHFTDHVAAPQYQTAVEQGKAILTRYDQLFEQFGFSKENLLYSFVFLKDFRDWQEFEPHYSAWVGDNPPAISAIEAHCTAEDRLIAMTLIVAVDE